MLVASQGWPTLHLELAEVRVPSGSAAGLAQEEQQNNSRLQEQHAAVQQQLSSTEAALAEAQDLAASVQSQLVTAAREVITFTVAYSLPCQAAIDIRPP